MLKKLGLSTLALAAALAVAAPTVSLAEDRDDGNRGYNRGRDFNRQSERYEHRDGDCDWNRGRDRDDYNRGRVGVGFGFYRTPVAPAPSGHYDQYGYWHPYTYNTPYGH